MTPISEPTSITYAPPVVIVGTVALDISHLWDARQTAQHVRIDLGGVCKHVACVLGTLGDAPRFVSARFSGELGAQVAHLLQANHVDWRPLPTYAPLSLFEAHLDDHDRVFDETFVEGESLELLTADALQSHDAFSGARLILSCTNLSVAALNQLADSAAEQGARFWLLCSSRLEAPKIGQIEQPLDLVSLNLEELARLVDCPLETLPQIGSAALAIKPAADKCLITLGSRGALLCQQHLDYALYQPVAPITGRSPVGGGDVLFAGLLGGKLRSQSWEEAFAFGARCARNYLLRDQNSAMPYLGLLSDTDQPLPRIERIPLHDAP